MRTVFVFPVTSKLTRSSPKLHLLRLQKINYFLAQNFKDTQRERFFFSFQAQNFVFTQNLSKTTDVRRIRDLKNRIIFVRPTLGLLHCLGCEIHIIKTHKSREKEANCSNLWRQAFSLLPDWSR